MWLWLWGEGWEDLLTGCYVGSSKRRTLLFCFVMLGSFNSLEEILNVMTIVKCGIDGIGKIC